MRDDEVIQFRSQLHLSVDASQQHITRNNVGALVDLHTEIAVDIGQHQSARLHGLLGRRGYRLRMVQRGGFLHREGGDKTDDLLENLGCVKGRDDAAQLRREP